MAYGIKLMVWGEYACFTRPELKVERVSYEVITPSAARGILEAIYWKPEIRWVVDRLRVLPYPKREKQEEDTPGPTFARFTHVRRNEIDCKIPAANILKAMREPSAPLGIIVEDHRQPRASLVLKDVCYGIEAHLVVLHHDGTEEPPEAKHLDQFNRRARRGECFHRPYLGCREFPAYFELVDQFPPCPEAWKGERDLGLMLQDIVFKPDPKGPIVESNKGTRVSAEPRFFRCLMRDGVIEVPPLEREMP